MSHRLLGSLIAVWLIAGSASMSRATTPPEKLEWNDLINHPERWPATCKLTKNIRFSVTDSLDAGTVCRVIAVQGTQAQLSADNSQFEAPADFIDLLDEANAAWAKLTPEQRALTRDIILKDRSLWPAVVTVNDEQNFGKFTIKAGETLPMLTIQQNHDLELLPKGSVQWAPVPMAMTDFFARARELASLPKDKRPARVAAILNSGLLVDHDGNPAQSKDAELYIIYWSGSQCQWCAQYNAKWVDYFKKTLADRKDVQVFSIGNDRQMPAFFAYAKKNQYAWPILPSQFIAFTEVLGPLGTIQMPGIIVFDRNGKIVASTLRQRGTPLQTADGVVKQIDQLLADSK
jgi:hypothetical protein